MTKFIVAFTGSAKDKLEAKGLEIVRFLGSVAGYPAVYLFENKYGVDLSDMENETIAYTNNMTFGKF